MIVDLGLKKILQSAINAYKYGIKLFPNVKKELSCIFHRFLPVFSKAGTRIQYIRISFEYSNIH